MEGSSIDHHRDDDEGEEEEEEEESCIPFASMREAIAPHLLAYTHNGTPRRLRITRSALLRLRRAAEVHLMDMFGISASLCELQRHSTLRLPAFRLATRLSSSATKATS